MNRQGPLIVPFPHVERVPTLEEAMWRRPRAFVRARPETILFFKMDDTYEVFHEDAEVVSQALGVPVESRRTQSKAFVSVVSVPLDLANPCFARLVAAGHELAIIMDVTLSTGASRSIVRRLAPSK